MSASSRRAVDRAKEGEELIETFDEQLERITEVARTLEKKPRVLFEIASAPHIYSTGAGSYLDQMITTIGAENVLADETSWVPVTEEAAVALNPDVIFTNVTYEADPVGDILKREGWEQVTAVKTEQVAFIDNNATSLANTHVIEGMLAMGEVIAPELFGPLRGEFGLDKP